MSRGASPSARPWSRLVAGLALAGSLGCTHSDDTTERDRAQGTTDAAASAGSDGLEPATRTSLSSLAIAEVELNQGVGITLVADAIPVPVRERNARAVEGRPGLLRVALSADEDFEPQVVALEVELRVPGRPPVRDRLVHQVDGTTPLERTSFLGWLPQDVLVEGTTMHLSLVSPDEPQSPGQPPDEVPEVVLDLDVRPGENVVAVHLVPFRARAGDCVKEPELSPEHLDHLRDGLLQMLPVARVDLTVREPVEWSNQLPTVTELIALRAADATAPDVFYYGVFPDCPCGADCLGASWGQLAGATPLESRGRVGLSPLSGLDALTLIHELGHMVGRLHVSCPGHEMVPSSDLVSGFDPEPYPYPGGLIGTAGYGILDHRIRAPWAYYDVMTYCASTWPSDVYWEHMRAFFEVARTWR